MRYEFKTADGRTCCNTDDPKNLCPACKARAASADPPDGYKTALARTSTAYTNDDPTDGYAIALKKGARQ